jgi:hypothetical protein
MENPMTSGKTLGIREAVLRWKSLLPPAAVLVAGIAMVAGSSWFHGRAADRFHRLSAEHRRWSQAVSAARVERGKEPAIRRAMEALEARAADEGNLRSVFDPVVSPGKGTGVETKSVSYKVQGAAGDFKLYEIRFLATGTYPEIARFLTRLEGGRSGFVVDNVSLRKGEKGDASAEIILRVPVR